MIASTLRHTVYTRITLY